MPWPSIRIACARFELRFQAVRRQNDCVAPVIRLIADRRLDPSPLLTHRFPLSEISAAFELVAGYRDGVIKAVVDVSGTTPLPPPSTAPWR